VSRHACGTRHRVVRLCLINLDTTHKTFYNVLPLGTQELPARQTGDAVSDESPVTVIARFTPTPEHADQLRKLLEGMVAPTRAEAGCQFYNLFATQTDEARYVLLECYEDSSALEAHRASPHYKNYRAQLADLLATPIDVTVLSPVDVRD
jgi:quinol monooxygenase YgiN